MSAVLVAAAWRKFICRACGLIYDEALGDVDSGLAAGTRFDEIADDWVCPLCGVTKADFEPYEDAPIARRSAYSSANASANLYADANPEANANAAASASASASPSRSRAPSTRRDPGVVIVGAGRAGWTMAEALRERDARLPLTIVSACDAAVYDKPMLSVVHAKGLDIAALARESAAAAAIRLDARLLAATDAIRVDSTASQLRTTRGTLRWRHLVLAHGAEARVVGELPPHLCWRINQLDAYRRFRAALGSPSPNVNDAAGVLIVGAGLVGCEMANDLALAGHRVTLLDVATRPLAALLPADDSARLLDALGALPIAFEGGVRVRGVEREADGPLRVTTGDGRAFRAAQVVAATGLQTPGRLAASAGLAFRDGIVVDPVTLATSVPNIHALGDCISIDGRASRFIEPIGRQARVIADRIVGREPSAYRSAAPPIRIKTTSLPFTIS